MSEAPTQYSIHDGTYVRCGATATRIPPGFYDVTHTDRGYGLKPKQIVADDLILMGGTVAADLLSDMETFMEKRDAFRRLGLTHKRGYLLHGPGGTGKTSIALMVARSFIERADAIAVFAPDSQSFYHGVSIVRDIEPGRASIYLLEEADRIVNNTHCLSILDGGMALDGAVFIAMTNYRGRLPARVTNRPGRFARVIRVDSPERDVAIEYLTRLMARAPDLGLGRSTPQAIVQALDGLSMSMDHLREALLLHVVFDEPLTGIRACLESMALEAKEDEGEFAGSGSDWWAPGDD